MNSRVGKIHRMKVGVPDFRVEQAEGEELPKLEGYAALFNSETDLFFCTESIAPGAFKDCIERGDDVRALIDHDPSLIIARTPKTLQLSEDEKGLRVVINPANTSVGRDIVESIRRGDITQMSFGFYIEAESVQWAGEGREKPHFTIERVRLFDVSPVTFPAYEETEIGLARSEARGKEEFDARVQRALLKQCDPAAERALREREIEIITLGL